MTQCAFMLWLEDNSVASFSALLLLLLSYPVLAQPRQNPEIVINEILFAPDDNELEFIELLNVTSRSINLCTYTFSDSRETVYSICEGQFWVASFAYVVLARDGLKLTSTFPGSQPITPPDWPALNNSGDIVQLLGVTGLVDEVPYQGNWGERGASIERIDPGGPSDQAFNWGVSRAPSRATPGQQNSIYAPDRTAPHIVLAEVLDTHQVFIVSNEPVSPESIVAENFQILQQRPASVTLLSPTTAILSFSQGITGSFLLTRGLTDLAGNRKGNTSTPLSFLPRPGDLIINEIMYEPLSDNFDYRYNQPEYVEVLNAAPYTLSLRSLYLTGIPNESLDADTLRSEAPYPVLRPGGYAIVFAQGTGDQSEPTTLLNSFPLLRNNLGQTIFLPITSSTLRLNNSGDLVRIGTPSAATLDAVEYTPSWHHPELIASRGIALERRSPGASSTMRSNWSSSVAPEGGTPGKENSINVSLSTTSSLAEVLLTPSPFSPDGDGLNDVLAIHIRIDHPPQSVRIRIFDDRGRMRRTLVKEALIGAESLFFWDGRSHDGNLLPTGIYIFLIELIDAQAGVEYAFKETAVLARFQE